MGYVEGTVKKYIKEYSRKLKNGKIKKYQTKQVQITLSKKDDIFQDEEEVIIMNKDVFKEYEKLNSTIEKQENTIYSLKRKIESLKSDQVEKFGEKIKKLNKECISLQNEHEPLKDKFDLLKKEIKYYKDLNDKLKELILKLT
ncbi:MAG: hypothetical protein LBB45_08185 [Methanobrevibacter sp.]|jgi:chromosome segregation ATPase|nr:hypothetical protein [Candidatus Methanovirga basalitermitum]